MRDIFAPDGLWEEILKDNYNLSGVELERFFECKTKGISASHELDVTSKQYRREFMYWMLALLKCWEVTGIEQLENKFHFKFDFPKKYGATGLTISGRFIPKTTLRHLHAALILSELTESAPIHELGAGFGGTCYWFKKIKPKVDYFIYDFPELNAIQNRFLDGIPGVYVELNKKFVVCPGIVFNEDGLYEMTIPQAEYYCRVISEMPLFLSINNDRDFVSISQQLPYLLKPMQLFSDVKHFRCGYRQKVFFNG